MKTKTIIKIGLTNPILLITKIYRRLVSLYKLHIEKDKFTVEVKRQFRDKGDETLRFNYPSLNSDSIVFDVGGYVGDFAESIHRKYGCTVYIFEPHPKFYQKCIERFRDNAKIIPLMYGLSSKSGQFSLSDSVDGSSFLNVQKKGKSTIDCEVRDFFAVAKTLDVSHVNLMKINIEGGEYPLMEHIVDSQRLDIVDCYQIQFHDFAENAVERRTKIVEALKHSHRRTWCYEFVWENWEVKKKLRNQPV